MSEDKRKSFMFELTALLEKYECNLSAKDHWTGYAECGEDVRMEVEFEDWKVEDIDLGTSFYADSDNPVKS
jgi:hypothetical protein